VPSGVRIPSSALHAFGDNMKILVLGMVAFITFVLGVIFSGSILCAASYAGWLCVGYVVLSLLVGMLRGS